MSSAGTSAEQILDAVDYRADSLPHPVDLLSADLIADISGVPKTTLLSATSSLEDLRTDVLTQTISRIDVVPGDATWHAMRASLGESRPGHGLAAIMHARADEIASDPAFPHFLSGFDRLASDGVANAIASTCSQLVSEMTPFADTVLHSTGQEHRIATPISRFSMLCSLLAMALQRLISGGVEGPFSDEARRSVAISSGLGLLADASVMQSGQDMDGYVSPPSVAGRPYEGSLGHAINAASDLLLSGGVPLRFGVRLDDVLRASGVSSATFYRRFGSLAGFERKLVERTGGELVRAFRDDFFSGVLSAIADESLTPIDAITELQRRAREQMDQHVATKRPGTEVLPWMATEVGLHVFAPAFMELNSERGEFFLGVAKGLGLPMAEGMDAGAVASTLHSYSWIAELLTRHAPDRELTAGFMHERSALIQQFVFGVA